MQERMLEAQTRREFCLRACETASLIALGAALSPLLSACKDDSVSANAPALPTIQASVSNNTITLTINANSPTIQPRATGCCATSSETSRTSTPCGSTAAKSFR